MREDAVVGDHGDTFSSPTFEATGWYPATVPTNWKPGQDAPIKVRGYLDNPGQQPVSTDLKVRIAPEGFDGAAVEFKQNISAAPGRSEFHPAAHGSQETSLVASGLVCGKAISSWPNRIVACAPDVWRGMAPSTRSREWQGRGWTRIF